MRKLVVLVTFLLLQVTAVVVADNVQVKLNSGGPATCDSTIEVLNQQPFLIKIEKTHNSYQGLYDEVSITKIGGTDQMGGFDFMVAYDAFALHFTSAFLGAGLTDCGWEYFTYRYGAQGDCGGSCPSGLLRVVAIADLDNGASQPSCFNITNGADLVRLKFHITNDWDYACIFVPMSFAWNDCSNNLISSVAGDTAWISDKVFGIENADPYTDPAFEITDTTCSSLISFGGACTACEVSQDYLPVRQTLFWNGGVDIVCIDSVDVIGDLNLNRMPYEIADAVIYSEYFTYGVDALDPFAPRRQVQIAASDINRDGYTLTVADLVLLLKIIAGDASPLLRLSPFANSANVTLSNGTVSTEASIDLGGVYATFKVNGAYTLTSNTDMAVISGESDGLLRVLVYSGLSNLSNRLEAGSNSLFTIDGNVELVSVEVSDDQGNLMNTKINSSVLPTAFALAQNVPNPFNAITRINMEIPVESDWTLEIVNINGQIVERFNGIGKGVIPVDWNSCDHPSGVYLYRMTSGTFTDTKKMLLLK